MTTQLLIYETAVPVSSGRHGKASIEAGKGFGFARKINSVPLTAVEFPLASAEYAIVFAQSGSEVVPVVILGARAGALHVAARGIQPVEAGAAALGREDLHLVARGEGVRGGTAAAARGEPVGRRGAADRLRCHRSRGGRARPEHGGR